MFSLRDLLFRQLLTNSFSALGDYARRTSSYPNARPFRMSPLGRGARWGTLGFGAVFVSQGHQDQAPHWAAQNNRNVFSQRSEDKVVQDRGAVRAMLPPRAPGQNSTWRLRPPEEGDSSARSRSSHGTCSLRTRGWSFGRERRRSRPMKGTLPLPFASVPRLQAAVLCETRSQTCHRARAWHLLIASLDIHIWKTKTFWSSRKRKAERAWRISEFWPHAWHVDAGPDTARPKATLPGSLPSVPEATALPVTRVSFR